MNTRFADDETLVHIQALNTEIAALNARNKALAEENERLALWASELGKDAERYRWLRAQHEGVETAEDAEGFSHTEPTAEAFTVFMPGKELHLEPVSCFPGELDAAIDAAMLSTPNADMRGCATAEPNNEARKI